MIKRQRVLGDFGEFALRSESLDEVLTEACRLVGEALGTQRAKILEIQEDDQSLLVRAGVGWEPGVVGKVCLPMSEHSSETYSIRERKPMIMRDIRQEMRFEIPAFMKDAGVIALANVPIFVPGRKAYGLLQVDAGEPRDFTDADTEFLRTYAVIIGPVIDRLRKIGDLRATEARFHAFVTASSDVVYRMSPDWSEMLVLKGRGFLDDTHEPSTGWLDHYIHPDDQPSVQASIAQTIRTSSMFDLEHRVRRADGSFGWTQSRAVPIRGQHGRIAEWLGAASDVTRRKIAEQTVHANEERFRSFAENSASTLWIVNTDTGRLEYLSPAFEAMWGEPREAVMADLGRWLELVHPDDREQAQQGMPRVLNSETFVNEYRIVRPTDGAVRWIHDIGFPIRNGDGRIHRAGGIAQDVTEEKQTAARLEIVIKELQHRSRNLLGIVSSVAERTLERGKPLATFGDRLQALGRSQGLLSQGGNDTVEVGALVRAELAAHVDDGSRQATISGPEVRLTARQVQNFALALHELTTNAVKYGALKDDSGHLSVTWEILRDRRKHRRLALNWVESGVTVDPSREPRRGYGTELIQEALAYALQAKVDYSLGADGVRCRIEMPIS
ncbi:PAS domain-containing protein [Methylobacterium tardum]|uniref:PAS domain-containing protein n=1 Tax=Methylobacterium tardum TaxID=374432 RepID=UPI00201FCB2B|nr:PAS domain-containing protein [Methylobacterium tardum]URD38174.1 PAS domain-containing protein [Methylobacterium tardum]